MKPYRKLSTVIVAAFLAGCTSPVAQIPPELIYSRKAADIPECAFIRGTDRKDNVPIFDHHTGCVTTIDGKRIMEERKRWSEEIPIEPGSRHIGVFYYHGAFMAKSVFDFDALPNTRYEVRFRESGTQFVDFWIVQLSSEKPVTDVKRGTMTGGGRDTFVPIFIPMK